jgi:hypothetical protein
LQGCAPKYVARGWPALWKNVSTSDHLSTHYPIYSLYFSTECAQRQGLEFNSHGTSPPKINFILGFCCRQNIVGWDNGRSRRTGNSAAKAMRKKTLIALAAAVVIASAATFFGYLKWSVPPSSRREETLALMPTDASAVLFLNFAELRQSPFVRQLYAWAQKPPTEADYAQFVKETGFDYERDLDRIAIAVRKRGEDTTLFAVLDGKFDPRKISAYALKDGTAVKKGGREIFSVTANETTKKISFAFLGNKRIAITNDSNLAVFLDAEKRSADVAEWRARFERLAGSPLFAVIRQEAALGATFSARAPGGLRSPQLSTLLDQLQWITVAGKPDNDRLRVVAEGECSAEGTVRQLADVMNGVLILAEAGLNEAKTRQQLDPAVREAYLELLRSADVSKIDRGDSKSVRLVFDLKPGFLEAASKVSPVVPDTTPSKPPPRKAPGARKGRT